MKVIVIFPDKLKRPVGGLGVQFKALYERLNKDVDFYIVGHPEDNDIPNYRGTPHPLPNINHGSINTIIGYAAYFAEAASFPKPDLVHAYDWTTYMAGVYLAKHFNVPLVVSMQLSSHGLQSAGIALCSDAKTEDGKWLHQTHLEAEIVGLHTADKIIHVSKSYAQAFMSPELAPKSVIIPNGIDLDEFDVETTDNIKLPGDNPLKVVYIGRFAGMKSFGELMNAKIPVGIDLILVGKEEGGDADLIDIMKKKVHFSNNVYWIGPKYGVEKIKILKAADAVIFPSKHEPFGIVGLEAFASNPVLITTAANGISDYADSNNSIIIKEPTSDAITDALQRYLYMSNVDKDTLRFNGYQTAKQFQWNDIAPKYLQVYKDTIGEK